MDFEIEETVLYNKEVFSNMKINILFSNFFYNEQVIYLTKNNVNRCCKSL